MHIASRPFINGRSHNSGSNGDDDNIIIRSSISGATDVSTSETPTQSQATAEYECEHGHEYEHEHERRSLTSNPNSKSSSKSKKRKKHDKDKDKHVDKSKNEHQASHLKPKHSSSPAAKREALLQARKSLPIWNSASAIRESLRARDVLVLVGETGCGKSTQVPQFLMDEKWCTGCIAITQPRRVAAVSLAKRVAEEVGCSLSASSFTTDPAGSAQSVSTSSHVPSGTVGYSVRFDSSTSTNTRIKYMTEGMLLQEMLRDRSLQKYSAVVLDEVHERSVNVDVLLAFLVRLVAARNRESGQEGKVQPLKLVVMSATAEAERLAAYLEEGLSVEPSPLAQVDTDSDSEASWSGISNSDGDSDGDGNIDDRNETYGGIKLNGDGYALNQSHVAKGQNHIIAKNGIDAIEKLSSQVPSRMTLTNGFHHSKQSGPTVEKVTLLAIKGRQYPVSTAYLSEPTLDCVEATLKSIFAIHMKEPLPGDVLCFLTGQDMIESLEQLVNQYADNLSPEVPKVSSKHV